METSAINYRVADFLKQHPPFHAVAEGDLIALAANGRVRFHEPNDYILWQGEPHKPYIYVIQQGTVSLWDDAAEAPVLRDVRGAGDLLGVERFHGARSTEYSARASSDVVIYAFPSDDFEGLVLSVPYAARYIEAYSSVSAEYQQVDDGCNLQKMFLHSVGGVAPIPRCGPGESIARVAQLLTERGAQAAVLVDEQDRLAGVISAQRIVAWVASGAGNPNAPALSLADPAIAVAPDTSVIDGALAMADADSAAVAITDDGTSNGRLQTLITTRDLVRVFGDHPAAILHDIRRAASVAELRELAHRVRAAASQQLVHVAAVDWVTRFTDMADRAIVARVIATQAIDESSCWCFAGTAGRTESLTRHAPQLVLIAGGANAAVEFERVTQVLAECDYLPRQETSFEPAFFVAPADEWRARFDRWLRDPILGEMYRARPLFDLRPIHGSADPWHELARFVASTTDADLVRILANDCLSALPPLTFYEDAVVDDAGEQTAIFRLERNALQPLVDVGRVFGLAARQAFGTSTLQRLRLARALTPEHEDVFREAAATFEVLLWLQGRIGIAQGTTGSELPPSLLSRHDRQLLKSGFRSIHRLLEFTADSQWATHV